MRTQTTPGIRSAADGVDRDDAAVGDGAAEHLPVQHPRHEHVPDELRPAGELLGRVEPGLAAADLAARPGLPERRRHATAASSATAVDDPAVAGAAAEVAGEVALDLLLVRQLAAGEQRADGQEHAPACRSRTGGPHAG